ncbi:MAG TPA: LytTR family DNA-binding domain-containing protein [Bacteroidia bacterium]|nr:LytTR family DNA-binding domain-containing protein [Bacteroidia bacterium]
MTAIIVDDDSLSRDLITHLIGKTGFLRAVQSFSGPTDALTWLTSNKVDLIFLDIEMPGMTGLEFIEALNNPYQKIILVTSHREFALEAFDHRVVDYLVKPITYPRFYQSVTKAKEAPSINAELKSENDIVFVKKEHVLVSVRKSDIMWVEAMGDYAVIHTHKEKFTMHNTLKDIQEKLPAPSFIRVHRSFLIRVDQIQKIEDNVISCNGKLIPIGKSYKEDVFRKLNLF